MSEATYCKYHQQTPARWFCQQCGIDFCNSCVNDQLYSDPPQCAVCDQTLSDMGYESIVPPFWHKIPLFFKIPLSLPSIIVIFTLLCMGYIFSWMPIVGWLLSLIVIPTLFFKYAYLTLQNIASGELKAPALEELFKDNNYNIVFQQIFIFFLLFAPMAKIFAVSYVLGLLWYLLVLFLIPATVMVLSIEENLFKAINPLVLLSFVTRIGFSYLGLYLLIMTISGGPTIIIELLLRGSDSESSYSYLFIIYSILQMYFTLVIFSVMGYVLLKYHHRLGYQISAPVEELLGDKSKIPNVHPLLKDIEVLVKENKLEDALRKLQSRVMENKDDAVLRLRFHKMLFAERKFDIMFLHAPPFIKLLLNGNDKALAVDVYRDCISADQNFLLEEVSVYLPLATIMLQIGQYKLIVKLLNGFHQRFANYQQIPQVYFVLAKALSDGLGKDDKSLSVINFIIKKYPESELNIQLLEYKAGLQKLLAVGAK